jgi:hypothetical protein
MATGKKLLVTLLAALPLAGCAADVYYPAPRARVVYVRPIAPPVVVVRPPRVRVWW